MKSRQLSIGLLSIALFAGAGAWALAQPGHRADEAKADGDGEDQDDEQAITLEKAPEAVQAAAIKLAGGAKNITAVSREEDDEDVVTFEVEYNDNTIKCAGVFSASGELMESERSTIEGDLPPDVLAALRKDYPGATLSDPQIVTRTFYEVAVVLKGKSREVKVDPAGNIEDDARRGQEHREHARGEKDHKDEGQGKHEERRHGKGAKDKDRD